MLTVALSISRKSAPAMSSTSDWLRAHPKPRSHACVAVVYGRRLSENSLPELRMIAAFFASVE